MPIDIAKVPMGWIAFKSVDNKYYCRARLGEGTPNISGGGGGWDLTKRQRRESLTEWTGKDPLQIDIPILFDNWMQGSSLEPDIRQLEKMYGIEEGMRDPPLIYFQSNGVVQHDLHDSGPTNFWYIGNIQWGSNVLRNKDGNRIRQDAVITVGHFVEDDALGNKSAAQKHKSHKTPPPRAGRRHAAHKFHIVKEGESIGAIAAHELGSASRWHEIAGINHIRDPKHLRKGRKLRLP